MDEYTRRIEKIEAELGRWLPEHPDASWAIGVFPGLRDKVSPELLESLTQSGWDLLNRGGKRWRPLLMTLICEALGGRGCGPAPDPVGGILPQRQPHP
ncbi:hypothetical protein FACS1894140_2550 [Spirochaetia bacterium]|nr:hypothetical protein FACS1894140_2550 [Spirochaetia bacterium]